MRFTTAVPRHGRAKLLLSRFLDSPSMENVEFSIAAANNSFHHHPAASLALSIDKRQYGVINLPHLLDDFGMQFFDRRIGFRRVFMNQIRGLSRISL